MKKALSIKAIYSFYIIISALLSAKSIVLTEIVIRNYKIYPLLIFVFGNIFGGVILLLIWVIIRKKSSPTSAAWKARDWAALIITALSTYGLAYLLSFDAVRQIGSSKTALLLLLETPFMVALAIIFLREKLSFDQWIAGILALIGVVLVTFEPSALKPTLEWGEIEAIFAGFSFALGIVISKPILEKADQLWLTSVLLLLGAISLGILIPFFAASMEIGLVPGLLIAVIGLLRVLHWIFYNQGLKHISASQSAILYLSFSFFAVAIQVALASLAPALGLQLPHNLIMTLSGGILIAIGIMLLETNKKK